MKGLKIVGVSLVVLIVLVFLVIFPVAVVKVYNSIFGVRIQTEAQNQFTVEHYPGLQVENVSFKTKQGHNLAGYCYEKDNQQQAKGVVVISHGFGGGGHCGYMALIDFFASNGYFVFAYDATGNDNSEGDAVGGFPQGVADLDYALRYVKSKEAYAELPIFLVGHSWGAYSVGNVLNFHTDVAGAVLFAGFNTSENLIRQEGEQYAGRLKELMTSYAKIYERLKYGSYAKYSVNEGIDKAKNAQILIVHSSDDRTVLAENGYDLFLQEHKDNPRVSFVLYDDRGHSDLFYDRETVFYRGILKERYIRYLLEHKVPDSDEARVAFRDDPNYVDFEWCFQLDEELMGNILNMFKKGE